MYLIVATMQRHQDAFEHMRVAHRGMRAHTFPVIIHNPEPNANTWSADEHKTWNCDDGDVTVMLGKLTEQFPGHTVRAYMMTHEAERPLGDLKLKQVTKDGVLPF